MSLLSPGLAQGAFELLSISIRQQLTFIDVRASFRKLGGMSTEMVCDCAQQLDWIKVNQEGFIQATNAGLNILAQNDYPKKLRLAILDYIEIEKPAWLQNVTFGRQRVLRFADPHLVQVFSEAGLVDGNSPEIVSFWDRLAASARGKKNDRATEIGRIGERLSLEYEERRTGRKPRWVAIDNNADGYDVLSVVSNSDTRNLSIEVKASTLGKAGSCHITRNEWDSALELENHLFHFWAIKDGANFSLAEIPTNAIALHIPQNIGFGTWESVEIPFKAFIDYFHES